MIRSIVQGVEAAHSCRYICLDLKPENLIFFVDEVGSIGVKFIDYEMVQDQRD